MKEPQAKDAVLKLFADGETWVRLRIAEGLIYKPEYKERAVEFCHSLVDQQKWDQLAQDNRRLIEAHTLELEDAKKATLVQEDLNQRLQAARLLALVGDKSGYPLILKGLEGLAQAGPFVRLSESVRAADAYVTAGLPYEQKFVDAILAVAERTVKGEIFATASFDLLPKVLKREQAERFLHLATQSPDSVIRLAAKMALQQMGVPTSPKKSGDS